MAMDATKRLLDIYRVTAVNLRRVADEMAERGESPSFISSSRGRAMIYETVVRDLDAALAEDEAQINREKGNS